MNAINKLHSRGVEQVCVTSLDYVPNRIVMLLSLKGTVYVLELPRLRGRYTGTGDLDRRLVVGVVKSPPIGARARVGEGRRDAVRGAATNIEGAERADDRREAGAPGDRLG